MDAKPNHTEPLVGRYAPSPTGRIHAGNIFASLVALLVAKRSGGHMVMRVEDLDPQRSRREYIDALFRDYEMLGFEWEGPVVYQSSRSDAYAAAFDALRASHCVYECFCTRADLHSASAPHQNDTHMYAGTCRNLSALERETLRKQGRAPAYRITVPQVRYGTSDIFQGDFDRQLAQECGDFIIRRNDGVYAYQLAVVVDDAYQGVTNVTRAIDLLASTPQQIFLQQALGLSTPSYGHLPLLVAEDARRLAKRDKDASIDLMLERYKTSERLLGHLAYLTGLIPEDASANVSELIQYADLSALEGVHHIVWK